MTTAQARDAHDALLGVAEQLVAEHRDLPAGSVLRCLARAVRHSLAWGCPMDQLPATAAATTRWVLAQRHGIRRAGARAAVPKPRRAADGEG